MGCETATWRKLHFLGTSHFQGYDLLPVIVAVAVSIHPVCEECHLTGAPSLRGSEVYFKFPWYPVRNTTDVPFISLRRAVTIYSPILPSRTTVSSHTVGTDDMKSVHSCSRR